MFQFRGKHKKTNRFCSQILGKSICNIKLSIYTEKDFKYIKETINELYKIGADAIIISDMGILTLDLPPIPLFASVNTKCLTADKINFLAKVGIKRVILPRELSLKEIQYIGKNTNIPLEAFIHGTMCVAYSGNCYFKYAQMIKNTLAKKELLNYQYFSQITEHVLQTAQTITIFWMPTGNTLLKTILCYIYPT